MWPALDASVQHLRFAEVRMDPPGRLFLCARCRAQVVLCSRCDRGNRYCGRPCRRLSRDAARRDSASRYQQSRRGRFVHAERSRRWRQRRQARDGSDAGGDVADTGGGQERNVTHQGCPPGPVAAPLVAWTQPSTSAPAPASASASAVTATRPPPPSPPCGSAAAAQPLTHGVRQGFLRHVAHPTRPRWRHDHSP